MDDRNDLFKKSEQFLQLLNSTKEFTEELLKENERLRFKLASLQSGEDSGASNEEAQRKIQALNSRIKMLEESLQSLEHKFRQAEEENKDFANRYIEIEEQNNNLANLYVASYQLHSTLDFNEVIRIVMEIIINLIGAETFCVMLLDEKTNDLRMVANEGLDEYKNERIQIGSGKIGNVTKTGEAYLHQSGTRIHWWYRLLQSPCLHSFENQRARNWSHLHLQAFCSKGRIHCR